MLIADSILGSLLMRSQGRAAWRRFNEALQAGRVPAREVADGVLVIFGGALLLTPGFLSDIFGLLFLLPPTRAVIRRVFLRQAMKRITVSMAGAACRRARRGRGDDVEGTAVDVDPRPGHAARARRVSVTGADEARRDAATDSVTFAFGDARGAALRAGAARARPRTGRCAAGQRARRAVLRPRAGRGAGARGAAGRRRRGLGRARARRAADGDRRPARAAGRVGVRRRGRPGLRARVRGARRARRARGRRAGRAARRDGRLRPALPRARHGPRRRARATRSTGSASAATRGASPTGSGSSWRARSTAWTDGRVRGAHRDPPGRRAPPRRRGDLGGAVGARGAAGDRGRPPLHHLRRRRPHAPGRPGAVAGGRGRRGRGARRARCCAARRSTSARCGWTARSSAGTSRAGRASAATTSCAAPRDPRPSSRTSAGCSPRRCCEGFARIQDDTGVPPRAFGAALARAAAADAGATRCYELEVGAITEAEFLATLERELSALARAPGDAARVRRALHGRAGAQRRAVRPLPGAARARRPARDADEQRARVGAAVAREAARSTRSSRRSSTRRSSGSASRTRRSTRSSLERLGLPAEACAFVDDLALNVEAARALGFAAVHFRDTAQAIAELDALLAA